MSIKQRKKVEKDEKERKETKKKKVEIKGNMWLTMVYFFWIIIGINFLSSYLITETWFWGIRSKWINMNTYIPVYKVVYIDI